jgi:hypothetical protein
VTSRCLRSQPGSRRVSAASTARSAQSSRGRGFVRRSTETSCRSTSNSTSLDAEDRPSKTSQSTSRRKIRYVSRSRTSDDHALPSNDVSLQFKTAERPCETSQGNAEQVDPAWFDFDDERDVQPLQRHGVDVEEVDREQTVGLRSQVGAPGVIAVGRWRDPAGAPGSCGWSRRRVDGRGGAARPGYEPHPRSGFPSPGAG